MSPKTTSGSRAPDGDAQESSQGAATQRAPPAAASFWLHRWFSSGFTDIEWGDETVQLRGDSPGTVTIPFRRLRGLRIRSGWFFRGIDFDAGDIGKHSISGLRHDDPKRLAAALDGYWEVVAAEIGRRLTDQEHRIREALNGSRYVRHSFAQSLHPPLLSVLKEADHPIVSTRFTSEANSARKFLRSLAPVAAFESARQEANNTYVPAQREAIRGLSLTAKANGAKVISQTEKRLTDDQADAIATDEDVTLVLAGAGSGKTALIEQKVVHLHRNQRVPADQILVLAYNRKAAEEIKNRLKPYRSQVQVQTFHAFGSQVIGKCSRKPSVAPFAEDRRRLSVVLQKILDQLYDSSPARHAIGRLCTEHRNEYRYPFDFETERDYLDHVRTCDLRALNGDKVRSLEELDIANWLTLNGIEFDYEKPYERPTADQRYRQYCPDFYLPGYDIYLEHFALNEAGRAPSHFERYEEGVEWKRQIHRENGTHLIETYSWEKRDGRLLTELEKKLRSAEVALREVSIDVALDKLKALHYSWLAELLGTCLQHVKNSDIQPGELARRAANASDQERAALFVEVFEAVRHQYEQRLNRHRCVDFEDLINTATRLAVSGSRSPFRYILVDEFQDISRGRMNLLAALRGEGVAFFLVGDDWQSIYRFAGADVRLFRECGDFLGWTCERTLMATFRYGKRTIAPTQAFIRRNPEQTQRSQSSASGEPDFGLSVLSSDTQSDGVRAALKDIVLREERRGKRGRSPSVLILGRYNHSREDVSRFLRPPDVEFSSVHKAKGREAEYVIVLDLKDEQFGFPSLVRDDPLLDLVLPPAPDTLPHAEERRLFYVAATRGRRGCYLVTDKKRPSPFVRELLRKSGEIRRLGVFAFENSPRCPRCKAALIVSQTGKTLRCTNHPLCTTSAPRCGTCKVGFAVRDGDKATCTNAKCEATRPCPSCSLGVLVQRKGPYGQFLGCTEYWGEPPCTYKRSH